MIVTLNGEYKSLNTFESEKLEKFTVITGRNGSGKSQLIELLTLNSRNAQPSGATFSINPTYSKIQSEGIVNSNLSSLNNTNWKSKIDPYIADLKKIKPNTQVFGSLLLKSDTWIDKLNSETLISGIDSSLIDEEDFKDLISKVLRENEPQFFTRTPNANFQQIVTRLFQHNFIKDKHKTLLVAQFVAQFQSKEIEQLSDSDFFNTPIPEHFLDDPKLFGSKLEFVFYNYAKRRDQNRRLFFEKEVDGDTNNSIKDVDFIEKFIPPWDSINQILNDHGINFQFKGIDKKEFSSDVTISFQLIKTSINKNIQFQNLSSGEKVILGLVIKLFTSQYYQDQLELPDLIVLDEPDAHLHPEMSKLLVDVLDQTFVNKLGVDVIMVTHSPSTVALCPDNSIYELQNEPKTSLKKIEKGGALEILTGNLPTLSIDYENHKQVFVESPTDVKYFQTLFNKLNQERNYPFKLYFISNSLGKGNCDQVTDVVNSMRKAGNKTSFGIIDWDLNNKSKKFVKVHGMNKRYSIENYVYDPLYISILLMNLNANNIFTELGIDQTYNQYNLINEDIKFLQKISDWFFNKYYEEFNVSEKLKKDLVEIKYLNGKKIKVPKWYLEFKGHDLEVRIKKIFNSLEGKYRSEGELQKEIILIMGKCYPFIPKDSEEIIESIINGG